MLHVLWVIKNTLQRKKGIDADLFHPYLLMKADRLNRGEI